MGNRLSKNIDYQGAGDDEALTYEYDRNDRLFLEMLDDLSNGVGVDETTTYQYGDVAILGSEAGDASQQTVKTVWEGDEYGGTGTKLSETTFEYDLRGRMKKSVVDGDGDTGSDPVSTSEYTYNDDGIRVSQTVDGDTTLYVVDSNNPTGYAQVLEEGVDDNQDGDLDPNEIDKSYVIGHDVIAQAAAAAEAMFLMADGHGSTRALLDAVGAIVEDAQNNDQQQLFAYDAYGNLVAGPELVAQVTQALTSLLYSGEQTDAATGLQYLRARYYSAQTGTFNRLDPFAGNFQDPQSLHKYLYTHGDPVNARGSSEWD